MSSLGGAVPYLTRADAPTSEQVVLTGSMVTNGILSFPNRGAAFLSPKGVNLLLIGSTQPQAKDFRDWLAGEVFPAVGYAVKASGLKSSCPRSERSQERARPRRV